MLSENRLSVQLLGQPMIFWGNKPITIPRKLTRIIIYYLACQKSMIGRTELLLLIWPDSPNARQQLRDHLSKLRTQLPEADIIVTDRDWIEIDHKKMSSDVLVFEDLYDQLSLPFLTIENRPLPEAIYQKMLAAVNMWKAPAFMFGMGVLDSDELNEWIADKNRKLRFKWLSLMLRIAQHLIVVGDLEGALTWMEKVTENDQDYEFPQAIYSRMDTLYHLGRLTQAYELGQEYVDHINTDWFAEYRLPFEVLKKKVEKERNQSANRVQIPSRFNNLNTIPLVGRDDLLGEMQKAYRRGNIIVLAGETGMGKTRILHEFVNRLTTPLTVLSMEAVYSERDIAFHPVLELLRKTMSMSDWQKIEYFWIAQLASFLPELQSLIENRTTMIEMVDNQRLSLYEAFRQVFMNLAGKHKILITLENAQWADTETIRLLAYLTQRRFFSEHANLFFVSNLQDAMPSMADYQENLNWVNQVALIRIPPLDLEGVANIGLYLLRTPPSEGHTHQLMEATGGNPLFVIETLQMMLENPEQLTKKIWDQVPISGVIHIIIRERLGKLSPDTRHVLGCAALSGIEFTFDFVQAMLDLSEAALVVALDELLDKDFIRIISQMQQPIRYKFNQTFVRDVVLQGLSLTQKQVLHKRLANYLLSRIELERTADCVAETAYHLGQAGNVVEAFRYWIEAANLYSGTDAGHHAYKAFENALQLSQSKTFEINDKQLYDLWIGWGELAVNEGDFKSASEYYHHAVQEGLYRNSDMLIGSGLSGEGYLFLLRGLPDQAQQYLDRATNYLKEGPVVDFIRVSLRKMFVHLYHFDLLSSISEFESIIWLENQVKTKKEKLIFANLLTTVGLNYVLLGKFKDAEIQIEKANQIAHQLKKSSIRMENEFAIALGNYYQGSYKKSLEQFGLALHIAESTFYWRFVLETLSVTSHVYLALGKIYQCVDTIQKGFNLAKVYQYTTMHSVLINAEGKLHANFGNFKQASNLFEEAIKFSTHSRNESINRLWYSLCQGMLGDWENGIKSIEQVFLEAEKRHWPQLQIEASSRLGMALFLTGETEAALKLLTDVRTTALEYGFAGAGTAYAYVRAQQALRSQELEVAREMATFILDKAKREESPWLEWHALQIFLATAQTEKVDFDSFKNQKRNLLRTLNQSKPPSLNLPLDPDQPPLFVLV
jgi:tetratricopeptide (TPR) repeat protein